MAMPSGRYLPVVVLVVHSGQYRVLAVLFRRFPVYTKCGGKQPKYRDRPRGQCYHDGKVPPLTQKYIQAKSIMIMCWFQVFWFFGFYTPREGLFSLEVRTICLEVSFVVYEAFCARLGRKLVVLLFAQSEDTSKAVFSLHQSFRSKQPHMWGLYS